MLRARVLASAPEETSVTVLASPLAANCFVRITGAGPAAKTTWAWTRAERMCERMALRSVVLMLNAS